MSGFLYFTEQGTKPTTSQDVAEWGVAHAFEGTPASSEISGRTPTGGKGWLFGSPKHNGFFGYDADRQEWRKIPKTDVWCGYLRAEVPSPDDLARSDQRAGEILKLADGNQWLIPRLRVWNDESGYRSALPFRADLDDSGNWVTGETLEADRALDTIADRFYSGMVLAEVGEAERISTAQLLDDACVLLGKNYLLSRTEVAMLGLLTADEMLGDIARIAMDWGTVDEWASKKNKTSLSLADVG